MTKEETKDKEGSKAGDPKSTGQILQPDPEIGPGGYKIWVRDWLLKALFENVPDGMAKLGERIKAGDIAILKFAIEQLLRLESELDDPVQVSESFAELLMKELERLPAETGDTAEAGAEAPAGT